MEQNIIDKNAGTYDETPYTSYAFQKTHPAFISGIAKLFNINTPEASTARVLELGCAAGGNIIPLAIHNPKVEVVGVDYSKVQVEQGQKAIEALGLQDRAKLIHKSIGDIDDSLGKFDYIICHGVYSWVPAEIRDAILRVSHDLLNKNGVAYISYNTYPGWKFKEVARDAMNFHTRNIDKNSQKIDPGLAMINFLLEKGRDSGLFKTALEDFKKAVDGKSRNYFAHEYLEIDNNPCYFYEFNDAAEKHHLRYLADAQLSTTFGSNFGKDTFEEIAKASGYNQVMLEQYMDFITNRQFRTSLLIRDDHPDAIKRRIDLDKYKELTYLTPGIHKLADSELEPGDKTRGLSKYKTGNGLTISTTSSVYTALLDFVAPKAGRPIKYEAIKNAVGKELGKEFNEKSLLGIIDSLICSGEFNLWNSAAALKEPQAEVPEKPLLDKATGIYNKYFGHITGANHLNSAGNREDVVFARLAALLDGKHTLADLVKQLKEDAKSGAITVSNREKKPITDDAELLSTLESHVKGLLKRLNAAGFFGAVDASDDSSDDNSDKGESAKKADNESDKDEAKSGDKSTASKGSKSASKSTSSRKTAKKSSTRSQAKSAKTRSTGSRGRNSRKS